MSNRPLSEEEICRKYGITPDDPSFELAVSLSRNRPDRTICEVPEMMCPHCGQEFTATYYDLAGGDGDITAGDEMPCPECDRTIYIEDIDEPDVPEESKFDGSDQTVYVTLCTHPKEG